MSGQEPQQQQQEWQFSPTDAVFLVFMTCHVWYLPLELFLRRRFGTRYIDGWLIVAALWPMFFVALLLPEYSVIWAWWGFWIILLLGIYHRFVALWINRNGLLRHSQYNGQPLLNHYLGLDEVACKMRWEVLVVMFAALLSPIISPSLMVFILGGLIAGVIKQGLIAYYRQTEMADLTDARFEQQDLAERFRNSQ